MSKIRMSTREREVVMRIITELGPRLARRVPRKVQEVRIKNPIILWVVNTTKMPGMQINKEAPKTIKEPNIPMMTTTSNTTPKHTMPHTPATLKATNGTTIKRIAQTLHKTHLKRKQKVDTVGSIRNIIKTNRVSPESRASTKSVELLEMGRQA